MGYNITQIDGVKINKNTKKFPVEIFPEQHELSGVQHVGILSPDQLPVEVMMDSEHQIDPHTMLIDGRNVSTDGSKLDTIETSAQVNFLTFQQSESLTSGMQSNWHHHNDWYYRKTQLSTPGESTIIWNNLINIPTEFNPSSHNHDDLYYTETEIDGMLLTKAELVHNHDERYYTETEIDSFLLNKSDITHLHDGMYYTETEIDGMLLTKAELVHNHDDLYYTEIEIDGMLLTKAELVHNHDDLYYTETEIDSIINNYSLTTHLHDDLYYNKTNIYTKTQIDSLIQAASFGISGSVNTFSELPTPIDDGIIYIVKTTVDLNEEGFYQWLSNNWVFLANNTGTTEHNSLSDLNTGNYIHLTQIEYDNLIGHSHDDLYYTETEIDSIINNYSLTTHNHDDLYYTETEIDSIINNYSLTTHNHDDLYYTETEIDGILLTKAELVHNHDDLYYTETEIDSFLLNKSDIAHNHDDIYHTKTWINSNFYTTIQFNNGQLDSRYYTETEIDSFLLNKSDITHLHDERYYTETEIDGILLDYSLKIHNHDDLYYTEIEIDSFLLNKSDITHLHDERYYTKDEFISINDNSSGADLVAATPLPGGSANTVQGILEEINQNISNVSSTLDESYDGGKFINADDGPVEIQNSGTNSPLQLNNRNDAPSTGLIAGQMSIIDNEIYIYDGVRENWLSNPMLLICGRNSATDGHILSWPGGERDSDSGPKMLKDGTITGLTLQTESSTTGKKIYLRINNSNEYTMSTINGEFLNKGININFNEGDRINILVSSSGTPIHDPVCTIEIKWRK